MQPLLQRVVPCCTSARIFLRNRHDALGGCVSWLPVTAARRFGGTDMSASRVQLVGCCVVGLASQHAICQSTSDCLRGTQCCASACSPALNHAKRTKSTDSFCQRQCSDQSMRFIGGGLRFGRGCCGPCCCGAWCEHAGASSMHCCPER